MEKLKDLTTRFRSVQRQYAGRDTAMAQVYAVRNGRAHEIAPDLFPNDGPLKKSTVANLIDVAARDMAESIAPLPTFTCSSSRMATDKDQARANVRTKLAAGYVYNSDLQGQMYSAADWYNTYGTLIGRVERDDESQSPVIRMIDPRGTYPVMDRMRRVTALFHRLLIAEDELCALYPEMAGAICQDQFGTPRPATTAMVEIVFYHDKHWENLVFMPGRDGLLLDRTPNTVGKVLVRVASRAGLDPIARGAFDDALWVQIAATRYGLLRLEAATKSVQAPLVVPDDVMSIGYGADAVIKTKNPAGVGRVALPLSGSAFQESASLEHEVRVGARYPEVRGGQASQSIITGRGVQELNAGYESQITAAQSAIGRMLQELVSLAFEVDEKIYATVTKTIRASASGSPFELKYTPAKDIKGDYTVEATYGLMAGLDPNRALVYALQGMSAGLYSKETVRKAMPAQIDTLDEEKQIDIEKYRDALESSIAGLAGAIPQMVTAGQDPTMIITALGEVIAGRRAGKPIEDLVGAIFAPPAPEPAPAPATEDPMAALMGGGGDPAAMMQGEAPGAGGAPGGAMMRPDMQTLLAGLTAGGQANLSANVVKQRPL